MNWFTWKQQYHKELEHIADYEEMFVDKVLSQIDGIEPDNVIPQYHFVDSNGKNRYIDFMIIDESRSILLPIELDGYAKMVGNGNDYERFNDFLYRQNEIIGLFNTILRFSNRQMMYETNKVIECITRELQYQYSCHEPKVPYSDWEQESKYKEHTVKLYAIAKQQLTRINELETNLQQGHKGYDVLYKKYKLLKRIAYTLVYIIVILPFIIASFIFSFLV